MMRAIVDRRVLSPTQIMRILECGHQHLQSQGGKAHLAVKAVCKECFPTQGKMGRKSNVRKSQDELIDGRYKWLDKQAANTVKGKFAPTTPHDSPGSVQCGVPIKGGPKCETLVDADDWCFGCGYYVCKAHDKFGLEMLETGIAGHTLKRHVDGRNG